MLDIAKALISSGIKAVDPYNLIKTQLVIEESTLYIGQKDKIDLSTVDNISLIGFGKGVAPMAVAMKEILGEKLEEGAVIVKYGHDQSLNEIKLLQAAHPVPDHNTLTASEKLLEIATKAGAQDLVIVLITGGGSALFESLPLSISLNDLAELNQILLSSGASIEEINCVRKHISLVKGGQLAQLISPAQTLTLILSDIVGDPLQSIASGPTVADNTTFRQVQGILSKYKISARVPLSVSIRIEAGVSAKVDETPKAGDPIFGRVVHSIIGNNHLCLNTLKDVAETHGYNTTILTDRMEGEAREVARDFSNVIKKALVNSGPVKSPGCIIMGGETTVTITGDGKGGRNQEFVLSALHELGDIKQPFYLCSVGTDGNDGPTDAAGAYITERTYSQVTKNGLNIQKYLAENDSYHFFERLGNLIKTGPTRTNVMDFVFCLF